MKVTPADKNDLTRLDGLLRHILALQLLHTRVTDNGY